MPDSARTAVDVADYGIDPVELLQLDAVTIETDQRFDAIYHGDLHDQRYTPETLKTAIPADLDLVECDYYQEMTSNDSLRVVLHPKSGRQDT